MFLAQVMAIYFIAAGVSMLAKKEAIKRLIDDFASHPYQMYYAGFYILIIGSLLVLSHNVWDGTWRVVITIIGWLTFLKGLAYLWVPQKSLVKMLRLFEKSTWYTVGSWIMILLGLYLAWIGFLS